MQLLSSLFSLIYQTGSVMQVHLLFLSCQYLSQPRCPSPREKQPQKRSTPVEFIRRFAVNYPPAISPGLLKHNFLLHKRSIQLMTHDCAMSFSCIACKRILRFHNLGSWRRLNQAMLIGVTSGVSELCPSGTVATTSWPKGRTDVFTCKDIHTLHSLSYFLCCFFDWSNIGMNT